MTALTKWTSLQAFLDVIPRLAESRKKMLKHLIDYVDRHGEAPTARELDREIDTSLNCITPLLAQLREYNAVHNPESRRCAVTNQTAVTWLPGPPPGGELVADPKKVALLKVAERIKKLLSVAPSLSRDRKTCIHILGITEKKFDKAMKQGFDEGIFP